MKYLCLALLPCWLILSLPHTGRSQSVLEAEDAYYPAGVVETEHAGYTGTGYVNTTNLAGVSVEWFMRVAAAGPDTLAFRYALGSNQYRYMEVYLNEVLLDTLDFYGTGSFTNYVYETIPVTLDSGVNRVQLVAVNDEGAPNLDHLLVRSDTLPLPYYRLTLSSSGNGSVGSTAVGDSALAGSRIILQALPDPGYSFASWSGDLSSSANPLHLLVDRDYTLQADFVYSLPAFPGAEGFGKYTTGGRGGAVIAVTNLNDTGPGSLRAAINASGPRTIVFHVSGTIFLNSPLRINQSHVTIAGQTAPGDGICIANYPLIVSADQVVIRYLRARLGDQAGQEADAFSANGVSQLMVDHCTFSWGIDEVASLYQNHHTTLQWCIISESLNRSVHSKGDHGYGGIWGGNYATFHHNLLAHHTSRNPRFNGARYETNWNEVVDFRNNVIYNWASNSSYGGEPSELDGSLAHINMVNNYYKYGLATSAGAVRFRVLEPSSNAFGHSRWHVDGNYLHGYPLATAENWTYGVQNVTAAIKAQIKADQPFAFDIDSTQAPEVAFEHVLARAGAVLPQRDAVDRRIVRETCSGTVTYGGSYGTTPRGIIDSQDTVGGWPVLTPATPPADSDLDGMPDAWELARGLNPNDTADRNGDDDSDGYTNLEAYLNSLVADFAYAVRPLGLTAVTLPGGDVQLAWTDIGAYESGFQIERAQDGGSFVLLAQVAANSTGYLDAGVGSGSYAYRLRAFSAVDTSCYTDPVTVDISTGIDDAVRQLQVYPNPFGNSLWLDLDLTTATSIQVAVYNTQGQRVGTHLAQSLPPGKQRLRWDAPAALAPGLYVVRITTPAGSTVRRVVRE